MSFAVFGYFLNDEIKLFDCRGWIDRVRADQLDKRLQSANSSQQHGRLENTKMMD